MINRVEEDKNANDYYNGKGQRERKLWKEVIVAHFCIITCKFLGRAK